MDKKLTILIITIDAYGHMYPCIGIGQKLLQKGHRVVFAIEKSWQGKLTKYGFEEEIIEFPDEKDKKSSENIIKFLIDTGILENKTPLEKLTLFNNDHLIDKVKKSEPVVAEILIKLQPDVVIANVTMISPSIVKQKLWINFFPPCPNLIISHENTPPAASGLPSTDRSNWDVFRAELDKLFNNQLKQRSDWFKWNNQNC